MQVSRSVRTALGRVATSSKCQSRSISNYKQRFTVVSKGLGVDKATTLGLGLWTGKCDSAGLMKLWPVQKLNKSDALRRAEIFSSVAEKGFPKEAGIGKARALIQLGEYEAARAALPSTTPADGNVHSLTLSTRVAIAVNELRCLAAAREVDPKMMKTSYADKEVEVGNLLNDLTNHLPDDWEAATAKGEFLLSRQDPEAINVLEKAVLLATREVAARRGNNEVYISDATSEGALADYVDYKYQNSFRNKELIGVLEPLTIRTDPQMEAILQERYPNLTSEELVTFLGVKVRLESRALGLIDYIQQHTEIQVRDWDSVKALEASDLMAKYTGDSLSGLKVHNELNLEQELENIEKDAGSRSVEDVLSTQKRVGTSLAESARDRAKTLLGRALSAAGRHQDALKVLNEVVQDNSFLRMYDTLMARGECYTELGMVDKADKDFQRAYSLEDAFTDRDIPTMDKKAYRNEF